MRTYPAINITFPADVDDDQRGFVLAVVDDCRPAAVEERPRGLCVFFDNDDDRDRALDLVRDTFAEATATPESISDENWAERSQASLRPVRIDRVIVAPPWAQHEARQMAAGIDDALHIVIQPSMGFGTGHHQSTRLCLTLLQRHLPPAATVLDIGTGSGVLGIAARLLGANRVVGVDVDRDALVSAAENIELNAVDGVVLDVADITQGAAALLTRHNVVRGFTFVFANITGAMLQRYAADVRATVAPGGWLITSGFQSHEVDDVTAAFAAAGLASIERVEEDTWVAAAFRAPAS